ncbi:MAG: type II secretion system protein [Methylophilaceae bacterium]
MRRIFKTTGFTLVEMVVVITIVSLLAAGTALFIRNPMQSYIDSENRADLTDKADTALRRMARDMRNALPNSVRVTVSGSDSLIEFVPVKAAGRYRAAAGILASDDALDFSLSSDTFEVLGTAVKVDAGDKLVIYNLGIPGSDVYEGTNIRPLTTTGTLINLSFSGGTFPLTSPSSRFFVVSTPVSYVCDMSTHQLVRVSGYAMQATPTASVAALYGLASATRSLLADKLTACSIHYDNAALQRNGIVTIALTFEQDNAKVTLMHQVNVVNSP